MDTRHSFIRLCLIGSLLLHSEQGGFSEPASDSRESAEAPSKTTTTSGAAIPAELARLNFVSRQQQVYLLKFQAMPDQERFQIRRLPSAAWPKAANFILKIGEKSPDDQIQVESIQAKEAKTNLGIVVDASELTVTHLPTGKKHRLVRGVDLKIPSYFAELKGEGKRFFVKEGDSFVIPENPDNKYELIKVDEKSVEISFEPKPGKIEQVKLDLKS